MCEDSEDKIKEEGHQGKEWKVSERPLLLRETYSQEEKGEKCISLESGDLKDSLERLSFPRWDKGKPNVLRVVNPVDRNLSIEIYDPKYLPNSYAD